VGQITITLTFLVGVGAPKMFASGRFRRSYATGGFTIVLAGFLFCSFVQSYMCECLTELRLLQLLRCGG